MTREVTGGPFAVGQQWRTHAEIVSSYRAAGVPVPDPDDCAGRFVVVGNDGRGPVLCECDGCGTEIAFRQATGRPKWDEGQLAVPSDDIPL